MEDEHLPECEYELVVVGTGLVECIVAGAAARVSKRVVHLDPNDFYGEDWASFQLQDLVKYARSSRSSAAGGEAVPAATYDIEALQPLLSEPALRFSDVEEWRTPTSPGPTEDELLAKLKLDLGLAADLPLHDAVRFHSIRPCRTTSVLAAQPEREQPRLTALRWRAGD
jgi:hypothetical protein